MNPSLAFGTKKKPINSIAGELFQREEGSEEKDIPQLLSIISSYSVEPRFHAQKFSYNQPQPFPRPKSRLEANPFDLCFVIDVKSNQPKKVAKRALKENDKETRFKR